jgi:hypothetical protein
MIPSSYRAIGWFRGAQAPLLAYMATLPDAPPCVKQLSSNIVGYAQAMPVPTSKNLQLFVGTLPRADVEACLKAVATTVGVELTAKQDGPTTQFTAPGGKTFCLGWTTDGNVAMHDTCDGVREAMAHPTTIATNKTLMALLQRTDTTRSMWMAAEMDVTTYPLGVPSQGFFLAIDMRGPGTPIDPNTKVPLTFVFASPADATRAVTAFGKAASDPRFSPKLQATLAEMAPKATGSDLVIDVSPVFKSQEVMTELTQIFQAAAQKR